MSDKVLELARMAGLIAPYGSDRVGLREFDFRLFAELIVRNCMSQCREISYAAMEIELDTEASTLQYDRGNKAGRKFGALDCVRKISETYDLTL